MKVFFSVGEPSGDLHGANLIRELRRCHPSVECIGYGGPRMAAAGCRLHADLTELAVMWFWRVLLNLHHFFRLWRQADRCFRADRPDAVVLIDYPGFNWWVARSAKRHGIPVFYYGVPQMWAWAGWRVKKLRRLVDHVLCQLPFEPAWFRARGCRATYVGHPFFDEMRRRELDPALVAELRRGDPLITVLPGSRMQEVRSNLPSFLKVAARVLEHSPKARFAVAAFNSRQAAVARRLVDRSHLPIQVHIARTPELIEAAHGCLACSGSVSLELLFHLKPTVILYRVSPLALRVQRWFRRVKYITLVNLLASRDLFPANVELFDPDAAGAEAVPFPEYLTSEDKSAQIAAHVLAWLTNPAAYQARRAVLESLKERFAAPGASSAAAGYILNALRPVAHAPVPPPHFDVRSAA
jgi:lipid-A-disaccharide synthase